MPDCIIIGAGIAGAQAATSLRQNGFSGSVTLIGEEAFPPYERPPLSKSFLTAQDAAEITPCFALNHYQSHRIDLVLGKKVQAIDLAEKHVRLVGGDTLPYAMLIIATGSRARRLEIPGADTIHTLRSAADAMRLRPLLETGKKVVCIGAGVIGLELASSARALGCEVTVIEQGRSVMGRSLPPEAATIVENLHRAHGVVFEFGVKVSNVENNRVILGDGRSIAADIFVAGVGAQRNIELAREAGLAVGTGVLVDEFGRTDFPAVYCVGEVAEHYSPKLGKHIVAENWQHAQRHSASVASGIAGQPTPYVEVPRFWTDQHGVNIQVVGSCDEDDRVVFRGDPRANSFSAFLLKDDGAPNCVIGFNAGQDVAAGARLIDRALPLNPGVISDTDLPLKKLLKPQASVTSADQSSDRQERTD